MTPRAVRRFTCNVCGCSPVPAPNPEQREKSDCRRCGSSIRMRAVALALSRALFGVDMPLCDFPRLKTIRGLGISDSEVYARMLEKSFSYRNTFLHCEPRFDLLHPDTAEFGRHHFIVCSEVLEHVDAPVEQAFETLANLLAPGGVLVLTAPYTLNASIERFPAFASCTAAQVDGRTVLIASVGEGRYQVFDQIVFHGGDGATVEMRVFSEDDLRAKLSAAGLRQVAVMTEGNPEYGVVFAGPCSLPIIAGKEAFTLGGEAIAEFMGRWKLERSAARASRWLKLGRMLGLGPEPR